jgi:hypothetical protein
MQHLFWQDRCGACQDGVVDELVAAWMALLIGWMASVVFRKD